MPAGPQARKSVLVVDDEPGLLRLLEVGLPKLGFDVRTAAGGAKAVEFYRQNQDTIDLVLIDVTMPGMDGPATLAALQQINPQVRCCFMTGQSFTRSPNQLLALGAAEVFCKPFSSLAWLGAQLRTVIDSA